MARLVRAIQLATPPRLVRRCLGLGRPDKPGHDEVVRLLGRRVGAVARLIPFARELDAAALGA